MARKPDTPDAPKKPKAPTSKAPNSKASRPDVQPIGPALAELLNPAINRGESGTCGTCRCRFIEGEPDHRDLVLSDDEKRHDIMICVSRAKSPTLTLDL